MALVSIRAGKVVRSPQEAKFKAGDYVFLHPGNKTEYRLMQVQGYDAFGQVVVVFVRHKHRKVVPWDVWSERSLVSAAEYGFYGSEA
jgi:hypothetical protein